MNTIEPKIAEQAALIEKLKAEIVTLKEIAADDIQRITKAESMLKSAHEDESEDSAALHRSGLCPADCWRCAYEKMP